MSVCGVCGRQVETSESGQAMPCAAECLNRNRRPLDAFLAYVVDTCVNPRPAPSVDYWRYLAEEHGDCTREFVQAGVQPGLCYEQATIAGHFGRLALAARG